MNSRWCHSLIPSECSNFLMQCWCVSLKLGMSRLAYRCHSNWVNQKSLRWGHLRKNAYMKYLYYEAWVPFSAHCKSPTVYSTSSLTTSSMSTSLDAVLWRNLTHRVDRLDLLVTCTSGSGSPFPTRYKTASAEATTTAKYPRVRDVSESMAMPGTLSYLTLSGSVVEWMCCLGYALPAGVSWTGSLADCCWAQTNCEWEHEMEQLLNTMCHELSWPKPCSS